jgi:PPOX class probable F420-dependent enzyme
MAATSAPGRQDCDDHSDEHTPHAFIFRVAASTVPATRTLAAWNDLPRRCNARRHVGDFSCMQDETRMAIPLPLDVRELLEAPNYVHLSTLRADGRPRNHVVWVGLEGDRILICTSDWTWKAKDMRRDPRVALSVIDHDNPYRMAAVQGRVVEERRDEGCRLMDPISVKYTGARFPSRGADRVCFVIEVDRAGQRTLGFVHRPCVATDQSG